MHCAPPSLPKRIQRNPPGKEGERGGEEEGDASRKALLLSLSFSLAAFPLLLVLPLIPRRAAESSVLSPAMSARLALPPSLSLSLCGEKAKVSGARLAPLLLLFANGAAAAARHPKPSLLFCFFFSLSSSLSLFCLRREARGAAQPAAKAARHMCVCFPSSSSFALAVCLCALCERLSHCAAAACAAHHQTAAALCARPRGSRPPLPAFLSGSCFP